VFLYICVRQTVQRGTAEDVRAQYADAVRRMALASMRSAKLARELECSVAAEKHLMQEKRELEVPLAPLLSPSTHTRAHTQTHTHTPKARHKCLCLH
jgi:hypothetical protein